MSRGRSSIDMKNARTAGNANAIFGDVQRHRPIGVRSYVFVTQERLGGARNRMLMWDQ